MGVSIAVFKNSTVILLVSSTLLATPLVKRRPVLSCRHPLLVLSISDPVPKHLKNPLSPRQLRLKIRKAKQKGRDLDPKGVAQRWIAYDLVRTPGMSQIPAQKVDSFLSANIWAFLRGYTSRSATISFLAYLRADDPELHVLAIAEMEKDQQRRDQLCRRFSAEALVRDWIAYREQNPTESYIPHPYRFMRLRDRLTLVVFGILDDAAIEHFCNVLREQDPLLYAAFSAHIEEQYRPPFIALNAETQRWAESWEKWYREKGHKLLLPTPKQDAPLRAAIDYYLYSSSRNSHVFERGVRERNRVLSAYISELADSDRSDPVSDEKPELSPEQAAEQWHLFYLRTFARARLCPLTEEDEALSGAIRRFRQGVTQDIFFQDLLRRLKENSPVLHAYLLEGRKAEVELESQGRSLYRGISAEYWAYEWVHFYRKRRQGDRVYPQMRNAGNLTNGLRAFKRGEITEAEKTAFLEVLQEWEPVLAAYAEEHLFGRYNDNPAARLP